MRLGVRLARLDPECERHAFEPWPLEALTHAEFGALFPVAQALRYAGPPVQGGPGANVVALRQRRTAATGHR